MGKSPGGAPRGFPTLLGTPAASSASTPGWCRAPRPAPSPTRCRPRGIMNLQEVLELIQLRRFERDPVTRLLNRTHMPDDFRAVAKRKLPRAVFAYVEGGADEEIAVDANRQAFLRRKLNPQLLRDVSVTDLTGELLGHQFAVPLGLAPTGYTRMMHPTGEVSSCSAAKAKGIPYVLSTMGTTTIEEVAATG